MGMQIQYASLLQFHLRLLDPTNLVLTATTPTTTKKKKFNSSSSISIRLKYLYGDPLFSTNNKFNGIRHVVAASTSSQGGLWNTWSPYSDNSTPSPSLSDIIWPSLGAFVAMAMLGKIDQMLAPKGITSMTIAPLGAVCAVLFLTPKAPAARKYNIFMAHIGCATIGVLAFSMLGPGWLARGVALAASLAFMIYTRSTHPPAAGLPLMFIDGAKFHGLNYWYALFPSAAGCILLSLVQEVVYYLKENVKF